MSGAAHAEPGAQPRAEGGESPASLLIAAACGLLFGLGLLLAGMANPLKVKAFLDVAGNWDPSLALVMAGGIGAAVLAFARARRMPRAWNGAPLQLPATQRIDARLLLGGALFGLGWGLAGYCPGPAIVALGALAPSALLYVPAMLVGMLAHDFLRKP